jgi:hypothetical protein
LDEDALTAAVEKRLGPTWRNATARVAGAGLALGRAAAAHRHGAVTATYEAVGASPSWDPWDELDGEEFEVGPPECEDALPPTPMPRRPALPLPDVLFVPPRSSVTQGGPVMPASSSTAPKLGDKVFYALRPLGEYVPAEIVNAIRVKAGPDMKSAQYLDTPIDEDAFHLEIQLDRKRHNAAASWGYRLNVKEGPGVGEFLREKPADADAKLAAKVERQCILQEETRRRMREQAGQ